MTKLGIIHCFIWIWTIGEQVKTRLNLAHWGSWDTVGLLSCEFFRKRKDLYYILYIRHSS